MSRDLTCKETMPAIEDGETMAGVRNIRGANASATTTPAMRINHLGREPMKPTPTYPTAAAVIRQYAGASNTPTVGHPYGNDTTETVRELVTRTLRNSNRASNLMLSGQATTRNARYIVSGHLPQHYTISAPAGPALPSTNAHKPIIGIAYAARRDIHPANTSYLGPTNAATQPAAYDIKGHAGSSQHLHPPSLIGNGSIMAKGVGNAVGEASPVGNKLAPGFTVSQQLGSVSKESATTPAEMTTTTTATSCSPSTTPPSELRSNTQSSNQQQPMRGASPYPVVMPAQSRSEVLLRGSPSRTPGVVEGRTTPTGQPGSSSNSHSSPRPSILRGNPNARRLLDKELARPASTSALSSSSNLDVGGPPSVNFAESSSEKSGSMDGLNLATTTITTSSASATITHHQRQTSSSSGEDSNSCRIGLDDSPRKRPRKQQFDISQLTQDKLMMEVKADPKQHEASASAAGDSAGQWRHSNNTNPTTLGAGTAKWSQAAGFPEVTSLIRGTRGRGGRRRGRPRSAFNKSDFLLSSTYGSGEAPVGVNHLGEMASQPYSTPAVTQFTTTGGEGQRVAEHTAISSAQAGPSASVIKSYMVDVDSILQPSTAPTKRKYRRRQPLVANSHYGSRPDDSLGRPRRRGGYSRRARALVSLQLWPSEGCTSGVESQQFAETSALESVTAFSRFGHDERHVISTLCRLRSNLKHIQPVRDKEDDMGGKHLSQGFITSCEQRPEQSDKEIKEGVMKERILRSLCEGGPPHVHFCVDPSKLNKLRPVLRRSDKNVDEQIGDQHDELLSFTERCGRSNAATHCRRTYSPPWSYPGATPTTTSASMPMKLDGETIQCRVLSNHDELRNSKEALRLLPHLCSYLQNSRRLLSALRCNLHAYSVCCTMKEAIGRAHALTTCEKSLLNNSSDVSLRPLGELHLVSNADYAKESRREVFTAMESDMNAFRRSHILAATDEKDTGPMVGEDAVAELDTCALLDELVNCVEMGLPYTPVADRETYLPGDSGKGPSTRERKASRSLLVAEANRRRMQEEKANYERHCPSVSASLLLPGQGEFPLELLHRLFLVPSGGNSAGRRWRRKRKEGKPHKARRSSADTSSSSTDESGDEWKRKARLLAHRITAMAERARRCYDSSSNICNNLLPKVDVTAFGNKQLQESTYASPTTLASQLTRPPTHVLAPASHSRRPNLYNPHRSTVLRPSASAIEALFKRESPPEESSGTAACGGATRVGSTTAVPDRLREMESRLILLEDLDEMEACCCPRRTSNFILQLQKRYSKHEDQRRRAPPHPSLLSPSAESPKKVFHWRKYSRTGGLNGPKEVNIREKLLMDSLKETREMAATMIELVHFRLNLMRQCVDSLRSAFDKEPNKPTATRRGSMLSMEDCKEMLAGEGDCAKNLSDDSDRPQSRGDDSSQRPAIGGRRSAVWRQSGDRGVSAALV